MADSYFEEVERWYDEEFENVYHSRLLDSVYKWVYRFMNWPHRNGDRVDVLELGSGAGNFRSLAKPAFKRYVELDSRKFEPYPEELGVEQVCGNAEDLSLFDNESFDRVIATCLLIHLEDPEGALREWRRVIKSRGSITIYVPPEVGFLTRLARSTIFWPLTRRRGYNARMIASLQHRYSYFFLDALIREVFRKDYVSRRTFPFKAFEYDLALFHVYEIKKSGN